MCQLTETFKSLGYKSITAPDSVNATDNLYVVISIVQVKLGDGP